MLRSPVLGPGSVSLRGVTTGPLGDEARRLERDLETVAWEIDAYCLRPQVLLDSWDTTVEGLRENTTPSSTPSHTPTAPQTLKELRAVLRAGGGDRLRAEVKAREAEGGR